MKNMTIKHLYLGLFCCLYFHVEAQELLSKEEAIKLTLENNFGIQIANNELLVAKNNAGILNSGYLPSLTGVAGGQYNIEDQEATFQDGSSSKVDGAETERYNASINLNFLLFDGLGRHYNYKSLKEQYNLSELEARESIEITLLQLFSVYFEVARLSENLTVLQETLENTKERLTRAEYQFEYGQNTRLEVLNAKVDITTDSVNVMNAKQALVNAKRDLNVVLNTELEHTFQIDTTVTFVSSLALETYIAEAHEHNVTLLQANQNILISDYAKKASNSVFLPSLGLTGSYGWNEGNFPSTNFLSSNTSTGFNAGINLTWNLFDGGRSIVNSKNAKIRFENQNLIKQQITLEVNRNIANAQGNYENRKKIYDLQRQNVETAKGNFERSNERYKLGQIASLELRQAQINLLNAQTNKNLAKYEAKLAELELLQLTGKLLDVAF